MNNKFIFIISIFLLVIAGPNVTFANGYYGYGMPPGFAPQPAYQAYRATPYGFQPYAYPTYPGSYYQPYQAPVQQQTPQISIKPEPVVRPDARNIEKNSAYIEHKDVQSKTHGVKAVSPTSKKPVAKLSKKQAFINKMLPIIKKANQAIHKQRTWLVVLSTRLDNGDTLSIEDQQTLKKMARAYRVEGDLVKDKSSREQLLTRVDIIPASLTLAQAANESAWGKSRFAKEANNLFGIWTYDESKGLIPKNRETGKKHFVRKFDSIDDSVVYYMQMLNSHPAYAKLREIRHQLRQEGEVITGSKLAVGLEKYSAKGDKYIHLIRQLISQNDWLTHDNSIISA